MISSTNSVVVVHQEPWESFARSMWTIACLGLATTTAPVLTRLEALSANVLQALLAHAVRVTSMSAFQILAPVLELKTAYNLSTIISATVNQDTWAAIVKLRSTSVKVLHARTVECADSIKQVTLVNVQRAIQA